MSNGSRLPTPWIDAAGIRRGDVVWGNVHHGDNTSDRSCDMVGGTVLGADSLLPGLVRVRRNDGRGVQILRMSDHDVEVVQAARGVSGDHGSARRR